MFGQWPWKKYTSHIFRLYFICTVPFRKQTTEAKNVTGPEPKRKTCPSGAFTIPTDTIIQYILLTYRQILYTVQYNIQFFSTCMSLWEQPLGKCVATLVCGKDVKCCAAKAIFYCPSMNSHRPRSQNTAKERTLKSWERFKKKKTQIACKFGEIIKKL